LIAPKAPEPAPKALEPQNFLKGAFGGPSASGGLRPHYPLAVQL
jgi:hypothetical protein